MFTSYLGKFLPAFVHSFWYQVQFSVVIPIYALILMTMTIPAPESEGKASDA